MKKATLVISILVLGFLATLSHAQDGGLNFTRIEQRSTPNCEMDSTTWYYNEETEYWDHSETMVDAQINAQVMPGSWLSEVMVVATFVFTDEQFYGDLAIQRHHVAQKYVYPYSTMESTVTYTKHDLHGVPGEPPIHVQTGYVGGQATFNLGFYYTPLGVSGTWDQASQGSYREMYADIEMVPAVDATTGAITPVPSGYLRIDLIRVKSFDGGSYCYAN